jgi:hypothetical protein
VGSKLLLSGTLSPDLFGHVAASFINVYDFATGQWSTTDASPAQETAVTTANDKAIFVRISGITLNSDVANFYRDSVPSPVLSGGITGNAGKMDTVTVINTGDAELRGPYTIQLYATTERTLNGAILVGSLDVASALAAGATLPFNIASVIPTGTPIGQYQLLVAVKDSSGSVTPIAAEDATFSIDRSGRVKPQGSQSHSHGGGGAMTRIGRIGGALT